ncbi:MAG TPA: GNAT family N-acetyltransferase [Acidimicrobiales bacterium]|nr:GNAT family N-acetyltransferase [Acidimicrobiales bacterium]
MTVTTEVLEWGRERARAGPWRGDGQVAYLAPLPFDPPPSADFLRRCLDQLAGRGYSEVITSALAGAEQRPFLDVGFAPHEQLRFLAHDLAGVPLRAPTGPHRLRKATQADWASVLDVDAGSFSPFWRLDRGGLEEALSATPATRFRVAASDEHGRGRVVGYAITGRAGDQGYLQRLAVAVGARRSGVGRALALDGLRWLRRRGVHRAVVNTQFGNDAALGLYLRLGFRVEPSDLAVLHRSLLA